MWDERYSAKEYAYGKTPNKFLEENYHVIPKGKVFCLAEGKDEMRSFLRSRATLLPLSMHRKSAYKRPKNWLKSMAFLLKSFMRT